MRAIETSFVVGALLAAGVTGGALANPAETGQRGKVDPKADELLRKMSHDLASMKTFSVDTENSTEVVTTEGQKLQLQAESRVSVQRPNLLRTDRNGAIADVSFFYDGQNVTVYGKRKNLYATAKAPGTLDQTIDFTRDQLGIDAPAADLLYSNPYEALMEDVVSGQYIGEEPIGDRMCHHLAYRGTETDWQIWIQDGPQALPCRFEITSKKEQGQPEYEVELDNWKTNPTLSPDMFTFTPPAGSHKIDFLAIKQRNKSREVKP